MTERDVLYREILARPDDDFPRRIYADWLADHGEVLYADVIYAELDEPSFVREAGRLGPPSDRCEQRIKMVEELLDRGFQQVKFQKGFVGWVAAPLGVLLEQGAWLVANHPVTEVRATDRQPAPDDFASTGKPWAWTLWSWDNDVVPIAPARSIPIRVFKRLPGFFPREDPEKGTAVLGFGEERVAHTALSEAILSIFPRPRPLTGH